MAQVRRPQVHIPRLGLLALGLTSLLSWPAIAADGQPEPWQMWYQEAASPVMERIESLNAFITWIMGGIVVFVLALLVVVVWRFNAKRNPVPSQTSHNVALEIAWTAVPILILVVIAIPSFRLLYFMDRNSDAEMTIKAIGHQWYWSYEYPDHGDFTFDAFMKYDDDLQEGEPRLLATDNEVVIPVGTPVRVIITSQDVIHSWAVPALGVKTDANPGRLNETWIQADRPGIYYGQCSELCGVNHGFMPIMVRAVPKEEFHAWVTDAQERFAQGPTGQSPNRTTQLAQQ
jgi:cytochrome c oxidase subunit 2